MTISLPGASASFRRISLVLAFSSRTDTVFDCPNIMLYLTVPVSLNTCLVGYVNLANVYIISDYDYIYWENVTSNTGPA